MYAMFKAFRNCKEEHHQTRFMLLLLLLSPAISRAGLLQKWY